MRKLTEIINPGLLWNIMQKGSSIEAAFIFLPPDYNHQLKLLVKMTFVWEAEQQCCFLPTRHLWSYRTATQHCPCGLGRRCDIIVLLCWGGKKWVSSLSIPRLRTIWFPWWSVPGSPTSMCEEHIHHHLELSESFLRLCSHIDSGVGWGGEDLSSPNEQQLWSSSGSQMADVVGHPGICFMKWPLHTVGGEESHGAFLQEHALLWPLSGTLLGAVTSGRSGAPCSPRSPMFQPHLGKKQNKNEVHEISRYKCFLFFLVLINTKWNNYLESPI